MSGPARVILDRAGPTSDPVALGDHALRLAADLLRIDTTNTGEAETTVGERAAAEYVATVLADLGLQPLCLEPEPRRTSVVARWPGRRPGAGALLVHAHLDVVPAVAADWTVPPFAGEVKDGVLWGRGAVDMKHMAATTLAAVSALVRAGRVPERDAVVLPYLMPASTDAKTFHGIGVRCLGFTPTRMTPDLGYLALFHAVDERVPVDALAFGARVLERLLPGRGGGG